MKRVSVFLKALLSVTAFFVTLSASAEVQQSAPFGLRWGVSEEDLARDFELSCKPNTVFSQCKTNKVPKPISIGDFYTLLFAPNFGLQKTIMFSDDITGDIYGSKGKEQYNSIKRALNKKYGKAETVVERVGMNLYNETDEFYQCLAYDGCGYYQSFWSGAYGTIGLQINGASRGRGWIKLSYEGPRWSEAVDDRDAGQREGDEDAF